MGAAIIAMESAALIVAVLAFGWPVLLIGAPLFVGTLVALVVVRLWEIVQHGSERRRAARWDPPSPGLMTGFFEVSAVADQPPLPPVDLPILRAARDWGRSAGDDGRLVQLRRPVDRVLAMSGRLPQQLRSMRRPQR